MKVKHIKYAKNNTLVDWTCRVDMGAAIVYAPYIPRIKRPTFDTENKDISWVNTSKFDDSLYETKTIECPKDDFAVYKPYRETVSLWGDAIPIPADESPTRRDHLLKKWSATGLFNEPVKLGRSCKSMLIEPQEEQLKSDDDCLRMAVHAAKLLTDHNKCDHAIGYCVDGTFGESADKLTVSGMSSEEDIDDLTFDGIFNL